MSQVTNLAYFYERSRKVRGGRSVWVKDSNGESRHNVLLGGTILNPNKGFGYLWAAQLMDYAPGRGYYIFRSFEVSASATASATSIKIKGDGYSDAPEVGQYLMIAPDTLIVDDEDYTGTYAKVTAVTYDADNAEFTVTLANSLGAALTAGVILVEADAAADAALQSPTGSAQVLCKNPNNWVEADHELLPTEGYGIENANYSISGVYGKQAWIAKMQPLPKYVLAKNKSYIPGIFEI